jgi:hypothetical protein
MTLRNRFSNNPRLLMMIGMACLLLACLPRVIHWFAPGLMNTPLSPDARDFTHGFLLGLSIAFNLLAVWKNTHRSNCAQ